ncbi:MAG TPA: metallophosphoesterase [Bacteroidales bacterium]|nr:metallophosphoesterase [Bacteroidales bacterium]HPT20823.1 metallophosphoesterase [Bacteroidales bacterium]
MPDKNSSADIQFPDQNKKPIFSFGLIADAQYSDNNPVGTRFYRLSSQKLKEAAESLKRDSADFIINLGDIIDKDFESYKKVLDILRASGVKTYHITGNHDYSVDPKLKNKLPVLQNSKKGYFSFVHEHFRFIFLDGNEISIYSSGNKTAIKQGEDTLVSMKARGDINAMDWNGGMSKNQLTWLNDQLTEATKENEKVFIICHFPVVPENVHNLYNYKEVLSILKNYHNIVAWFNGHNHAGNYGSFNMIHFVTIKGMVETEENNSFALVEVYSDKVLIKGYGREESRTLTY